MSGITTGDKQIYAVLQGTKRISHVFDDDEETIISPPAWFSLVDDTTTGNINVVLADEEIDSPVVMSVQQAHRDNILIKKIYDTDTTISESDCTLYK